MKIKIDIQETNTKQVFLTRDQARQVTKEYLQYLIGGEGCYVTSQNTIEHWTSWPHGSGTTTPMGPASDTQIAAFQLNKLI